MPRLRTCNGRTPEGRQRRRLRAEKRRERSFWRGGWASDISTFWTPQEGDRCPVRCGGTLAYIREGDCSCHISPPCGSCVDAPLKCDRCGEYADE